MLATEPLLVLSTAGIIALGIVAAIIAWGWQGWLRLKHHELEAGEPRLPATGGVAARIEVADLKERIRKLEAIAAGVDL